MIKISVTAVIISFNPDIALLDKEYRSVVPQVNRVIYVDNCSINRTDIKRWLEGKEKAEFIWLDDNEGIGVAQNEGIRKALSDGTTHVIIFDQDSVVDDGFVVSLYEAEQKAIADGVKVGLTGPVYQSYDDNFDYPIWSIENNRFVQLPLDSFEHYTVVSHIIASGSLIRREVVEEVGLLREDWFLGYIDFEYCFRAANHGYISIVTKKACMHHQMGDSQVVIMGRKIGLYTPFRRYFDCRNTLLIQREEIFPKVLRRRYLKLVLGKVLISLIYGPSRWKQLRYCLKGFYDGIRGRGGKPIL